MRIPKSTEVFLLPAFVAINADLPKISKPNIMAAPFFKEESLSRVFGSVVVVLVMLVFGWGVAI